MRIQEEKGKDISFADVGHLVAGENGKLAMERDNIDLGVVTIGQAVGLIHDCPTVAVMMENLVNECISTITRRLPSML